MTAAVSTWKRRRVSTSICVLPRHHFPGKPLPTTTTKAPTWSMRFASLPLWLTQLGFSSFISKIFVLIVFIASYSASVFYLSNPGRRSSVFRGLELHRFLQHPRRSEPDDGRGDNAQDRKSIGRVWPPNGKSSRGLFKVSYVSHTSCRSP